MMSKRRLMISIGGSSVTLWGAARCGLRSGARRRLRGTARRGLRGRCGRLLPRIYTSETRRRTGGLPSEASAGAIAQRSRRRNRLNAGPEARGPKVQRNISTRAPPGQTQGIAGGEEKPGRNILAQARGPANKRAPMALTSFCPATLLPSQFTRSEKTGNIKRGVRTACDADSC